MGARRLTDLMMWLLLGAGFVLGVILAIGVGLGFGLAVFAVAAIPRIVFRVYLPPENVQTVFRDANGYLTCVVNSGETHVYSFWAEKPAEQVSMRLRNIAFHLTGIRTRDQVPFNVSGNIYFTVDLTKVRRSVLPAQAQTPDAGWEPMVRAVGPRIILDQWGKQRAARVIQSDCREAISREMTVAVGRALEPMGVVVQPRVGVSIAQIHAEGAIHESIQGVAAAPYTARALVRFWQTIKDESGMDAQTLRDIAVARALAGDGDGNTMIQMAAGHAVPGQSVWVRPSLTRKTAS